MASALLRRKALDTHTQQIEDLRDQHIPHAKAAVAKQLAPLRDLPVGAMAARMHADRDEWIQLITAQYASVGKVFAQQTVAALGTRLRIPQPDKATGYNAAYSAFINTYATAQVPSYVTHIDDSFAAHMSGAGSWDPTQTDDRIDDIFAGVTLVVGTMIVLTASNLGPLASANAVEQSQSMDLIKTWQALEDNRTRPTHSDADGQTQSLSDPFDVGDSQLMFPCDASLGADIGEIIYCRCVATYDADASKRGLYCLDWPERLMTVVVENLPDVAEYSRLQRLTKEWDESLHPREPDGKFGSGGGSGDDSGGSSTHASDANGYQKATYTFSTLPDDPAYHLVGMADIDSKRGDLALESIQKAQGFDGKPDVVSEQELQSRIDAGGQELWRGEEQPEFADQYMTGDLRAGMGAFGHGTYTAEQSSTFDAQAVIENYSRSGGASMRMCLGASANVANYDDLKSQVESEAFDHIVAAAKASQSGDAATKEAESGRYNICTDVGRYAAARGYDAIYVPSEHYYVVLNRTAVSISSTVRGKS